MSIFFNVPPGICRGDRVVLGFRWPGSPKGDGGKAGPSWITFRVQPWHKEVVVLYCVLGVGRRRTTNNTITFILAPNVMVSPTKCTSTEIKSTPLLCSRNLKIVPNQPPKFFYPSIIPIVLPILQVSINWTLLKNVMAIGSRPKYCDGVLTAKG